MRARLDANPVTMPAAENDPEWIVAHIKYDTNDTPQLERRKCATPEDAEKFFQTQRAGCARIFRRYSGRYFSHSLIPVLRDEPRDAHSETEPILD